MSGFYSNADIEAACEVARAAERERCAEICDAEAKRLKTQRDADVWCGYADTGALVCRNLIRSGSSYGVPASSNDQQKGGA